MYKLKNRDKDEVILFAVIHDKMKKYPLSLFLQSADIDEVEISDKILNNFKQLAENNAIVESFILEKEGYEIRIAHSFRSMTTYHRLKKQGKKPSVTSQHFFGEAVDCHIYYRGERIRGLSETKHLAEEILKEFPDLFLQVFAYQWGIHFSIETERSKKAGIRRRFGIVNR